VGQAQLGLESPGSQMTWLGESWLSYGRLVDPLHIERRFAKVTAAEIREVAHALFRPERIALAVVGPGATEEVARGWIA